ncbi:MAG: hypothetical protein ABI822_34895, partial [Bryobacteraceae bacterium]
MKFLGITAGCTATTYCSDYFVTNSQVAVFAVRARQIRETTSVSGTTIYTYGTVNNAITCPQSFSCVPYYTDVPESNSFYPWIQKARELSGATIHAPTCSNPAAFCPEDPVIRGQIAFFLVYGVLASTGLAPQQPSEAPGSPYLSLPAATGANCSGSVITTNDIYLLSSQDYYASSSTRGTFADPSLWTMTVTASVKWNGSTVYGPPAQPVKTDANSNLRLPTTLNAPLTAGNYLQTSTHTAVSGPCNQPLSPTTKYSYPYNGTAPYFPTVISTANPGSLPPGGTATVAISGHGLTPGSSLIFSRPGISASTTSVTDTLLTANISVASNTTLGPVNISVLAANLGNGDPRANFTSNSIPFTIGDPLQTLRDCINGASGSSASPATCALPAGSYTVSAPVVISKSYVTIQGASSQRLDTKLVRDPAFTDAILRVDAGSPLTGVTIQNLTICGSTTLNPGASPVGCPRTLTTCGTMVARQTQGNPLPTDFQCVDLDIKNADTG